MNTPTKKPKRLKVKPYGQYVRVWLSPHEVARYNKLVDASHTRWSPCIELGAMLSLELYAREQALIKSASPICENLCESVAKPVPPS